MNTKVLPRTTPEVEGISSSAIVDFLDSIREAGIEMHSLMLLRRGNVVAEGWWKPYAPDRRHVLFSLSKSFTSTAVGLAVDEGLLALDDRVVSYFPDDLPEDVGENLAKMRLRDLLTMGTGHGVDTVNYLLRNENKSWERVFLERPVEFEPGTHFHYNSGATYMAGVMVSKVTGMSLTSYLTPRLFEPLGIVDPYWEQSPTGYDAGGWGLNIRTEDIAKFGQLYLQKGRWGDRQLIPKAWVELATSKQIDNGPDPNNDWNQGYCFQFWRCRHDAYRGDGAFGQFCVVMPELDAVFAATSGTGDLQGILNCVWNHLLPSMSTSRLEDPVAHARLLDRLEGLSLPTVDGSARTSSAAEVSGKTFQLDTNEDGWQSITATFGDAGAIVEIVDATGLHRIEIAGRDWSTSRVDLAVGDWSVPFNAAISGAWTGPMTYELKVCACETPFTWTLTLAFDKKAVTVDRRLNVAFGPVERPRLFGRMAF